MDNNFALFIDDLRKSRNISRTQFVEGIISERQYYRFIKGDSSLKSESLMKLFNRLELNSVSLVKLIRENGLNENKELVVAYNFLYENKYKEAYDKLSQIDFDDIQTEYHQKMYTLVKIISSYNLKLMSKKRAIDETKTLIDYPSILNKESLNTIESSGLNFISAKLIQEGDHRIASYTYDKIIHQNTTDKKTLIDLILYISLAKNLGSIGEYEKTEEISKIGIKEYINSNSLNLMESMLYLQALSQKCLDKSDDYKKTLTRLFAQLYAEDNQERFAEYEELVKKKFQLKVSDLITFN